MTRVPVTETDLALRIMAKFDVLVAEGAVGVPIVVEESLRCRQA